MDFKNKEIERLAELIKSLQKGNATLQKKCYYAERKMHEALGQLADHKISAYMTGVPSKNKTATEVALEYSKKLEEEETIPRLLDIEFRTEFRPGCNGPILRYRKQYQQHKKSPMDVSTYWTDWKT